MAKRNEKPEELETTTDVVETTTDVVEEIETSAIVKFESNGSGVHMKKDGVIYEIPASLAKKFVSKKLGKIVK